jgi:hypothetical protein
MISLSFPDGILQAESGSAIMCCPMSASTVGMAILSLLNSLEDLDSNLRQYKMLVKPLEEDFTTNMFYLYVRIGPDALTGTLQANEKG